MGALRFSTDSKEKPHTVKYGVSHDIYHGSGEIRTLDLIGLGLGLSFHT